MAVFKLVCWVSIFIKKLCFPPDSSITTILFEFEKFGISSTPSLFTDTFLLLVALKTFAFLIFPKF